MIEASRISLVPATPEMARAEIRDRERFARLLEARVPENWPPESVADALPPLLRWLEASPGRIGWT